MSHAAEHALTDATEDRPCNHCGADWTIGHRCEDEDAPELRGGVYPCTPYAIAHLGHVHKIEPPALIAP